MKAKVANLDQEYFRSFRKEAIELGAGRLGLKLWLYFVREE